MNVARQILGSGDSLGGESPKKENMKKHFFKVGKEKLIKGKVSGYIYLCKICKKTSLEHENWEEAFMRSARAIGESRENYPILKLKKKHDSLNGPPYKKYFNQDIGNKINEIIEYINSHE